MALYKFDVWSCMLEVCSPKIRYRMGSVRIRWLYSFFSPRVRTKLQSGLYQRADCIYFSITGTGITATYRLITCFSHTFWWGDGFNQHCHKISTVLHHIGFRSTSLLLFTLNIFNISTVFTLNELSSPLFFHQHGFQSTLFSLNTAYHLH